MSARLEHANITVADPQSSAAWMQEVFGWHIRWEGAAINGGFTVHVGSEDSYLALYRPAEGAAAAQPRYANVGALNHVAVVVKDIKTTEAAVKKAGFTPINHADYEPGLRFYFLDQDGVDYEVVQYD